MYLDQMSGEVVSSDPGMGCTNPRKVSGGIYAGKNSKKELRAHFKL